SPGRGFLEIVRSRYTLHLSAGLRFAQSILRFLVGRGLAGLKLERDSVHAIPQPGRLGPVLEDMPEMPAAASAMHLGAAHEKAAVGLGLDPVFEGRPEARPSRAAVEFGSGVEQRLAAGGAVIDPGAVLLVERARPGALGAVLAQYPVLLGVQLATPFLVAVLDLEMLVRFRRCAAAAQAAQQTFCHIACLAQSGGAAVNIGRAGDRKSTRLN